MVIKTNSSTTITTSKKKSLTKVARSVKVGGSTAGDKKSTADRIIELVAKSYALGRPSLSRDRLAMATDLKAKTITNTLPKLQSKGLLTYTSTDITLTEAGIEAAGDAARRPSSNAEHQARIKEGLKKREIEIFDLLADGKTWNKDTLAKNLGYDNAKQKTFVNCIGGLSGKKIVEYPNKGEVHLTDTCFLLARGQA
jgi:Mn-dependent DtxR family transcriptional regulator